jgi:hypothetical protein
MTTMQTDKYQSDLYKEAVVAAKHATQALQKLISTDARVILVDLEQFETPRQVEAKKLVQRCMRYFEEGKLIISSSLKVYLAHNAKKPAGELLMFLDPHDKESLETLLLSRLENTDPLDPGLEESALTETLNVIGNAYINVVAQQYNLTLMSMVPQIITDATFDQFINEMISGSQNKLYMVFDTQLIVTRGTINIPFLLAVAVKAD